MHNPIQLKSPILCFPIEMKSRDFDPRLYLAAKFAQKGYRTVMGPIKELHDSIKHLPNCPIYFSKGMNRRHIGIYNEVHDKGGKIVLLDEENYIPLKGESCETTARIRNDPRVLKHVDMMLVWGESLVKRLESFLEKDTEKQISVVGHIKFDICKKVRQEPYKSLMKKKMGIDYNYVIVSTAFGVGNHILGKDKISKIKTNVGDRFDEHYTWTRYHYQRYLAYTFVTAIKELSKSIPDTKIVVRPHPMENVHFYSDKFEGYNNIIVSNKGTFLNWLSNASLIIHHDCTTGLEAAISGTPVFSYAPSLDPDITRLFNHKISHCYYNKADLVAAVVDALKNPEKYKPLQSPELLELVRMGVANITSPPAWKRIVTTVQEHILSTLENDPVRPINIPAPPATENKKPGLLRRIYYKLRTLHHRPDPSRVIYNTYVSAKLDTLKLEDFDEFLTLSANQDSDNREVRVRQLKERLFEIAPYPTCE